MGTTRSKHTYTNNSSSAEAESREPEVVTIGEHGRIVISLTEEQARYVENIPTKLPKYLHEVVQLSEEQDAFLNDRLDYVDRWVKHLEEHLRPQPIDESMARMIRIADEALRLNPAASPRRVAAGKRGQNMRKG